MAWTSGTSGKGSTRPIPQHANPRPAKNAKEVAMERRILMVRGKDGPQRVAVSGEGLRRIKGGEFSLEMGEQPGVFAGDTFHEVAGVDAGGEDIEGVGFDFEVGGSA